MAPIRHKSGRFMKKSEVERREKASESVQVLLETKKPEKPTKEPVYSVGRRVVAFSILAREMWCPACDIPLSLLFLEEEMQRGLASILHIRCAKYLDVRKVHTCSPVKGEDSSIYPLFAVNCKAAAGCLDSGIGHEQLNKFLTCLNIPPIHHHTIKRAEAKIGSAFESAANSSCIQAIAEEKALMVSTERM